MRLLGLGAPGRRVDRLQRPRRRGELRQAGDDSERRLVDAAELLRAGVHVDERLPRPRRARRACSRPSSTRRGARRRRAAGRRRGRAPRASGRGRCRRRRRRRARRCRRSPGSGTPRRPAARSPPRRRGSRRAACAVQPPPPTIANGRFAPASSSRRRASSSAPGWACSGAYGCASSVSTSSASMSSGSASTTGPGPAGRGGREGAVEVLRDALGAVDLRDPLREPAEHGAVVDLLERLAAGHVPRRPGRRAGSAASSPGTRCARRPTRASRPGRA